MANTKRNRFLIPAILSPLCLVTLSYANYVPHLETFFTQLRIMDIEPGRTLIVENPPLHPFYIEEPSPGHINLLGPNTSNSDEVYHLGDFDIGPDVTQVRGDEIVNDGIKKVLQVTTLSSRSQIHLDETQIRWRSDRYQTAQDLAKSWSSHFAGALSFPDPYNDPSSLLKLTNPRCSEQVAQMERYVESYAKDSEKSSNSSLSDTRDQISELLKASQSNGCFEDVSRLLAARSLTLLALDNRYDVCEGSFSNCHFDATHISADAVHGFLYEPFQSQAPSYHSFVLSNNWMLNLIAISLINHGHVVFMTPESKAQLGFGSDLLGAYDCGSGKIYLNPFMAPFDLAATFAHEIEHVLRDKLTDSSQLKLSAKQFLLLDETLSAAYASFLERDLKSFYNDSSASETLGQLLDDFGNMHFSRFGMDSHSNYVLDDDISFFNPDGALNSLWNGLGFHHEWKAIHSLSDWSDFEDMTFLRGEAPALNREGERNVENYGLTQIDSKTQSIYEIVKRVYFKEALSDEDRVNLAPSSLKLDLDPLTQALRSNVILLTKNLTSEGPLDLLSKIFVLQPEPMSNLWGQFTSNGNASYWDALQSIDVRFRMDGLLEKLDLLEAAFSEPSGVCKMIDQAAKNGELQGYAGFRKGVDGVRPGIDGVRPGVDGVRPGVDGVRPGMTLRPCVSIPKTI